MREFENPDHWDVAAKHYQKTAHPFTAHFAEAALARIPLTSGSVLDIATGTGALALAAAAHTALVVFIVKRSRTDRSLTVIDKSSGQHFLACRDH
ncbi:putative RNA methylase [Pseudomonas sp. JUb42]|nr:putative RNA methylase [Pseudomonas sp. JUb42]